MMNKLTMPFEVQLRRPDPPVILDLVSRCEFRDGAEIESLPLSTERDYVKTAVSMSRETDITFTGFTWAVVEAENTNIDYTAHLVIILPEQSRRVFVMNVCEYNDQLFVYSLDDYK